VKRILATLGAAAVASTLMAPATVLAQDREPVPLKLQIVISRYQGEKKISSMPYTLWMTANMRETTRLRMGVQVPVTTTVIQQSADKGTAQPIQSWQYRDIGTNIDALAQSVAGGAFNVSITLNDSAVQFDKEMPKAAVPTLRTFSSSFHILLKDGQTAQYSAATDPVSGEVMRVEATLNVLK
jgi:hypothetical protein